MKSIPRFFYFKKYRSQEKRGFTLLEVLVALWLLGIFATLLMSLLYHGLKFAGEVSKQLQQCQELRKLCEVLTTDCRKLFLSPAMSFLELDAFSQDKNSFSLLLLRRFTQGWEHAFISQSNEDGTCALVQYRFFPEKGVIARLIWRLEEAQVSSVTTENMRLKDILPQEDAMVSRDLVQNVTHFELYALDLLGQRQVQWMQGSSVGLEYSVTFRSMYPLRRPQTFYTKIPVTALGNFRHGE